MKLFCWLGWHVWGDHRVEGEGVVWIKSRCRVCGKGRRVGWKTR